MGILTGAINCVLTFLSSLAGFFILVFGVYLLMGLYDFVVEKIDDWKYRR